MAIKLTLNHPETKPEPKPFPKLMWNEHYGCVFYMVAPTKGVPLDGDNSWAYDSSAFFTTWNPKQFEDYNKPVTIQNK